jgi:hypothetical protein
LALGFALLFGSYLVYAHYLGGIDGLPPLPAAYLPSDEHPAAPQPRRNLVEERLVMAFGEACTELSRPIQLEIHSRGVVLATGAFSIERDGERDGQVKLEPLSLAIFSKKTAPNQFPEITTVKARKAYIRFDRPINSVPDMAKAKIVGAELIDDTEVVNNRGKAHSNDELVLRVPRGSVFYAERAHPVAGQERLPEIWTEKELILRDFQSKPDPTCITAQGMAIYLTPETTAPTVGHQQSRKPRTDTVSGVERIVLKSNVTMHVFTDPRSGFLANTKTPTDSGSAERVTMSVSPPKSDTYAPKAEVVINTAGPFSYDVLRDFALFNVPESPTEITPHRVHVARIIKPAILWDQLDSDRLELQFRRKKPGDSKPAPQVQERSVELEIETAHATGKEVILTSDAETLHVSQANDFFYDARTRKTTVKGSDPDGIAVFKEAHELRARELVLDEQSGTQHMTATGQGMLRLFDKMTRECSVTAHWNDKLVSSKDGELDLLVFTGDARFDDTGNGQHLQAEELKVWLEPSGKATPEVSPAQGPNQNGRRPQRVEATGHVIAKSRELNIHDTEKMILTFKDSTAQSQSPASQKTVSTDRAAPGGPPATGPIGVPNPSPKPESDKPARPLDLSAHLVEARVLRLDGGKNELEKLRTEGQVQVHQDPEKPGEKGLEIEGDTLEVTKQSEGNLLVVTGDLAKLQMDKVLISGPQVNIDQAENKAWVNGDGAMMLESNTNFQGAKLNRSVPLTILWRKGMLFQGTLAQFSGDIQAEQENSRLACQSLQATLDQPISFRQSQKNGPSPKVDRLVCDRSVSVEDTEYEGTRLIKYQRLECR